MRLLILPKLVFACPSTPNVSGNATFTFPLTELASTFLNEFSVNVKRTSPLTNDTETFSGVVAMVTVPLTVSMIESKI
ncbi:hypothetical protein SDC9_146591 [bioreactor metagenome]|uniref:Uncharacterized protein n=1 Tax=bioreactor metagenome TaxID=1076179 RepID=A0A645EC31_9ZZZZ